MAGRTPSAVDQDAPDLHGVRERVSPKIPGHERVYQCRGCGLRLPARAVVGDHRVNASPECAQVYAEVAGFALEHLPLLRLHQLTVDTYGAQHGGGAAPPIRLAYSLVGLHLAVEPGLTGEEVRAAHQRMASRTRAGPTSHHRTTPVR